MESVKQFWIPIKFSRVLEHRSHLLRIVKQLQSVVIFGYISKRSQQIQKWVGREPFCLRWLGRHCVCGGGCDGKFWVTFFFPNFPWWGPTCFPAEIVLVLFLFQRPLHFIQIRLQLRWQKPYPILLQVTMVAFLNLVLGQDLDKADVEKHTASETRQIWLCKWW